MALYQSRLSNYLTSSPSEEGVDIESVKDKTQTALKKLTDEQWAERGKFACEKICRSEARR